MYHCWKWECKKKSALKNWSILRAKAIPLGILRQPKTDKNEEIIPFIIIYNTNNPNVFPIIKQSFDKFQFSKTSSNIFHRKKLVKSISQAPNLGRSLCRSKFESQHKNYKVRLWKELRQLPLSFKINLNKLIKLFCWETLTVKAVI